MDITGGHYLPGERTLWTGSPTGARPGLVDACFSLYLAGAVVVIAVLGPHWLRDMPGIFKVMAAIVWGAAAVQSLAIVVNLLVIQPRIQRRSRYEVTNYRVIVNRGQRVIAAYLDQVGAPVVRRGRDGGTNIVFPRDARPVPQRPFGGLSSRGPFALAPAERITRLTSVPDADTVRDVITAAQQRMLDDGTDPVSLPEEQPGSLPGITLGDDERVLWTGRPASVPWWFGGSDVYLSVFAFVWLAFAVLLCVAVARSGGAAALVFFVPFAAFGGGYPCLGRVIQRRRRIARSSYLLTDRRVIATWRVTRREAPVVVQAPLTSLLPPVIRGTSVFTIPAMPPVRPRNGWREIPWPASAVTPPALIGLADAPRVWELISSAQLANRETRV